MLFDRLAPSKKCGKSFPWGRVGARTRRWSAGAVELAGDVVGVGDDLEDAHAAAALATDRPGSADVCTQPAPED